MAKPPGYTDEELAILRRVYPTGGVDAVRALIPHRSKASLATKACSLGLKMSSGARGKLQKARKGDRKAHRPYASRGDAPSIDTVPPEFKQVASVFHIGERIKK